MKRLWNYYYMKAVCVSVRVSLCPSAMNLEWHNIVCSLTFWHHDIFLTLWQILYRHDESCVAMTHFMPSRRTFRHHDQLLDVMTYFWHHGERIFNVMTNSLTSWHNFDGTTNFLTPWRIFDIIKNLLDVMTYFWRHGELFYVMTYYWCNNVFFRSWRYFLRIFEGMTNFLT